MGTGIHCSVEKRIAIFNMFENGKQISEIAEDLGFSRKMVYNAINHVKQHKKFEDVLRKKWARKTTVNIDRAVVRASRKDPFKSSTGIKREIEDNYGLNITKRLVRCRLTEAGLHGSIARRKPLVSTKNLKKRRVFVKKHLNKPMIFWKISSRVTSRSSTGLALMGKLAFIDQNAKSITLSIL